MHQRGRGRRELHVLPRAEHALDEHLARLARHTLDSALRVLDRERERAARVAPDQRVAVAELFEHLRHRGEAIDGSATPPARAAEPFLRGALPGSHRVGHAHRATHRASKPTQRRGRALTAQH
eukprot:4031960-Prymnesium_polylepis.1